ncbi:unnamed protein product [Durusdinium trenchii]|uniref:Mitochondrial import inner membrane translocase subunit n=1 Tax=Durusdinium trenchii TaxID=1381693 RepID=A0ABP0HX77_9DINO
MDQLSQRDQMQVMQALNEMQMQEMMNTYNNLVEKCFNECITSFRTKALEGSEEQCVTRCVQKFMSFSQLGPQSVCFQLVANMLAKNRAQETVDSMWRRVSLRFQEKQQQMQLQQQHG